MVDYPVRQQFIFMIPRRYVYFNQNFKYFVAIKTLVG